MDNEIVEEVTEWESQPFAGGYAGLRELADQQFTGAVTSGSAWLFVLNGRIVAAVDGSIEAFENAEGTAYRAPHPSVPLLFAMQHQDGETKAKYYTEDTPLSEVNGTLASGNFTGYVELSENVLSGDYYVMYHGGQSLACAFIGNNRSLLTGDEAFERADDEVGIYEVRDVDLEVISLPDDGAGGTGGSGTDVATGGAVAAGTDGATGDDPGGSDETTESPTTADEGTADDVAPSDEDAPATDVGGGSDVGSDTEIDAVSALDEYAAGGPGDSTGPDERAGAGTTADDPTTAEESPTGPEDDSPVGTDAGAQPAESDANEDEGPAVSDVDHEGDDVDSRPVAESETDTDPDATAADPDATAADPDATAADSDATAVDSDATDIDADTTDVDAGADAADAGAADAESATGPTSSTEGADEVVSRPGDSLDERTDQSSGATTEQRATESDRPAAIEGGTAASDRQQPAAERSGEPDAGEDPFSEEAEWRNAQSIPSLDPANSEPRDAERPEAGGGEPDRDGGDDAQPRSRGGGGSPRQRSSVQSPTQSDATAESESEARVTELRERLREVEAARSEAEAAKERLAAEREELREERDTYQEKAQRLQSRVEELESEVERLRASLEDAGGGGGAATRTMPSSEALAGTNLFVRYETKGGATLEKLHEGAVDHDAMVENLRLEHHTSFDTEGLQVAGEPFEQFLRETVEYRFVRWIVADLLEEIRETGHEGGLQDLFDAIPEVDRVELHGAVDVEIQQNGDTRHEQEEFDVVLRDRMGNPLLVADLNTARDPASGEMMTSLVEAARRVEDTNDSLDSAFFVTTSYFQPDALETADDATGGGLLDRGKRESFVKLSRKRGFHLCLVETRDGNFHVNVPEL